MAKVKPVIGDKELLNAALEGLEAQRGRIEEQIREVTARLNELSGPKQAPAAKKPRAKKKRRPLSAEARKRIALAQKKRWAAFRKKSGK